MSVGCMVRYICDSLTVCLSPYLSTNEKTTLPQIICNATEKGINLLSFLHLGCVQESNSTF